MSIMSRLGPFGTSKHHLDRKPWDKEDCQHYDLQQSHPAIEDDIEFMGRQSKHRTVQVGNRLAHEQDHTERNEQQYES